VPFQDRVQALQLIETACRQGARLQPACRLLGISIRTYQRWRRPKTRRDRRCEAVCRPQNKLNEAERQQLLAVANSDPYADLPPCQIVPRLADEGVYLASESSFYRVLREARQLMHRQKVKPKLHCKPKELIARHPNQLWSWDISYLATEVFGLFYYLYLIVDIFSRYIVGWSIHERESSDYAALLVEEICEDQGINRNQVTLHSDNGSPMKGSTLQAKLQQLGVITSFSRPGVSNDNPFSESLFKTVKYCHFYPERPFGSIEAARQWMVRFVRWYNTEHYHSELQFTTPEQRHKGLSPSIVEARKQVYQQAKARHPERWKGPIRNWDLPEEVVLNPKKKKLRKK
jgi:putative transposase